MSSKPAFRPIDAEAPNSPLPGASKLPRASPPFGQSANSTSVYVIKRNGQKQPVSFDKILQRIDLLCNGLDPLVDSVLISQKVVSGIYAGVKTSELDELAAQTAAYMSTKHPDYGVLAARIAVSNLHKLTHDKFTDTVERLHKYIRPLNKEPAPLIGDDVYQVIMANADTFNNAMLYDNDYNYDYFGFKTLERSYLLRCDGKIVERPQDMLMRVAVGIHKSNVEAALETYRLLSGGWFTHASPTLFNAGTPRPQMSSCFLVQMEEDSIDGIYSTLRKCANISKFAGGIGVAMHKIRATGSYIAGTNGTSNGLVPMLRVYNDTARYVDQGGGKRKGAFAVYLEPWHADIVDFLQLKKNHGKEEARARDLFYGLWVPDLFMERVERDEKWSLFCPHEAPGLQEVWGDKFVELYTRYEKEGRARKQMDARALFNTILESQVETGTPYMLFKDAANGKSNQQNLGTIQCSNLCTEVIEYTAPDEVAVCNLASIALPKFVEKSADGTVTYNHERLREITEIVTRNLNRVIDLNYYPIPEARKSNMRHRPVGIGVQGFADTLVMMGLPFESDEALQLNRDIFETIYFGAVSASVGEAARDGPYETYAGSPASEGKLQYDLWGVTPTDRWDWASLKAQLAQHGMRNSLLVAPMPTASTAQILGNNESFEPFTSNIYTRRVLAGEFAVVNKHLLRKLQELGVWNDAMKEKIIANNGSVQGIAEIPAEVQRLYKTVWEISQRRLIDMAAARGAFIDQSQSFNLHMQNVNFGKLTSAHFHSWKAGLKTGMYYLRTKAAADAIKFTVQQKKIGATVPAKQAAAAPEPAAAAAAAPESTADEAAAAPAEDLAGRLAMVCALNSPEGECLVCGS